MTKESRDITDEKWQQAYNEVIDDTITFLSDTHEQSTPADIGLVLRVLEDYFQYGREKRVTVTLSTAIQILDHKQTSDELSWFDVYDTVLNSQKQFLFDTKQKNQTTTLHEENPPTTIPQTFLSDVDCLSPQADNLVNILSHFTQQIRDEKEILSDSPGYDHEEQNLKWSQFHQVLGITVGFQYGKVEIPNNASRMRLVDVISLIKNADISDRDKRWIGRTIEEWARMYARAEAALANENTSSQELGEFMIKGETPAERYW